MFHELPRCQGFQLSPLKQFRGLRGAVQLAKEVLTTQTAVGMTNNLRTIFFQVRLNSLILLHFSNNY